MAVLLSSTLTRKNIPLLSYLFFKSWIESDGDDDDDGRCDIVVNVGDNDGDDDDEIDSEDADDGCFITEVNAYNSALA